MHTYTCNIFGRWVYIKKENKGNKNYRTNINHILGDKVVSTRLPFYQTINQTDFQKKGWIKLECTVQKVDNKKMYTGSTGTIIFFIKYRNFF